MPVTAGALFSFLNVKMQSVLNEQIEFHDCKVSIRQAEQIKKLYLEGELSEVRISNILSEELDKSSKHTHFRIDCNKLRKYFPNAKSAQECEKALWDFLEKAFC